MDPNCLICTTLLHLGQCLLDSHSAITNLMTVVLLKQKKLFSQVKGKLDDFLTRKVIFILSSTSIRPQLQGTLLIPLNMLKPILHSLKTYLPAFSFTIIDNRLSSFGSPDQAFLTPVLDSQFSIFF